MRIATPAISHETRFGAPTSKRIRQVSQRLLNPRDSSGRRNSNMTPDKESKQDKKTLDLVVEHGRLEPGQDAPTFSFEKTIKVGEAAKQAATAIGFSPD